MLKNVRQMVLMLSFLWLLFGIVGISYAQVVPGIDSVGGFESTLPSFWNIGNQPTGATLSWATDQSRNMGHSLKIVKPAATTDSASWVSSNMCNIWSPQNPSGVDILLGAYVMTQGVNTNPVTDDQKWYVAYSFWDSAGTLITTTKLPINQSTASSTGFVADTNGVGQTVLDRASWKTIVSFVAGKNATGTVWAGDFIFTGRANNWAGQDWNTAVGVPTGFYYWMPPIGGNDGVLTNGFENTVVTTEAAHSGTHSLKFNFPATHNARDGYIGTLRFPINASIPAHSALKINVWVKALNLVPDSAAKNPGSWAVGVTPLYFAQVGPNDGYNNAPNAKDYVFTFPNATQFDWTLFSQVDTMPTDPTYRYMEVRLHVYAQFVGTVYFDDLTISTVTGVNDKVVVNPLEFNLSQNYPNPFNPSTSISYTVTKSSNVTLKIYDLLGNEVKTLVNANQNAGNHSVVWNGENNSGSKVVSGTYIYTLRSDAGFASKKMILLK
jgi:hypothetical protein